MKSNFARSVATFIAFIAFQSAVAAKSEVTSDQILKLFSENGCVSDSITKQAVRLNFNSKNKKDLFVYCETECGANQCSYSIYTFQNNAYIFRGSFTGNYKISKNKSIDFFDLVITASTATGKIEKKILKFNGAEYQ